MRLRDRAPRRGLRSARLRQARRGCRCRSARRGAAARARSRISGPRRHRQQSDDDESRPAPFSTPGPDRLLVGVFVWGTGGTDEEPLAVTGGNLTWDARRVLDVHAGQRAAGDVRGDGDLDRVDRAIRSTRSTVSGDAQLERVEQSVMTLAVYSFVGASPTVGANGAHSDQRRPNGARGRGSTRPAAGRLDRRWLSSRRGARRAHATDRHDLRPHRRPRRRRRTATSRRSATIAAITTGPGPDHDRLVGSRHVLADQRRRDS